MTHDRTLRTAVGFGIAVSSALIVAAARGDLWLDEIWSIDFARLAATPLDIVHFHHDNNHVLNTFYLYFVRTQRTLIFYRLFAIACGIGTVVMSAAIARAWGRVASIAALVLTGTSYPLVLYFSEARGYAAAMFFALLAFWIDHRSRDHDGLAPAMAFWIACALGTLAHLTFSIFIVAITVAHVPKRVSRAVIYCVPAALFAAWWYAFFSRDLILGRGPVYPTSAVIEQTAAMLLGIPETAGAVAVAAAVLIVAFGTREIYRLREKLWLFFPIVCLVAPAALLVVMRPRYLYFRYFVVCFPFFLLMVAALIDRIATSQRWLALGVVAIFVALQTARLYPLITVGRGHYREALQRISSSTAENLLRVSSDDDVANGVVLRFYADDLPPSKTLRYIPLTAVDREPPEWFITHTQRNDEQPAGGLILADTIPYRFVARYPFAGVSGSQWFVFRRVAGPSGSKSR